MLGKKSEFSTACEKTKTTKKASFTQFPQSFPQFFEKIGLKKGKKRKMWKNLLFSKDGKAGATFWERSPPHPYPKPFAQRGQATAAYPSVSSLSCPRLTASTSTLAAFLIECHPERSAPLGRAKPKFARRSEASEQTARRFTPLRDLIKSVALQCTISNVLHGKGLVYTHRQKRFLRFWRSLHSVLLPRSG